ncbi:MAG: alpha/beta hydrolase [Parachlamydiales bacterium]|nr:alpha/beta hydrolase [Verrucomicrobiota bacterium]MBX3718793.1 alpha/beta hydrolase [Candidatus Acheromyda pituitae]
MLDNDLTLNTLDLDADIQVAYLGPDISEGPLPALFYFALSSEESLCQDPFNQPAAYLSGLPMRIFSLTLPGHGYQLPATQAMTIWAKEIASGRNFIREFIDKVQCAVEGLIHQGILLPDRLGTMGLSRGAFIATHAAAQIPHFRWIVGFAPLTKLSAIKEFQEIPDLPLTNELDLENLVDKVWDRNIRFYIGNLDTRVGTRNCFDFVEKAAQKALEKKLRSPQIELIVGPSIGHQGHGTGKEVFHNGAQWIAERLGAIDVV